MFFIPIVLAILIGVIYLLGKSFISLGWIYFIIAALSTGLLILLLMIGFLDTGMQDGGLHDSGIQGEGVNGGVIHDTGGQADIGATLSTVNHEGTFAHNHSSPFIISPTGFLIVTALFGAFGTISYYLFSFLPSGARDFLSIISATVFSIASYIYVISSVLKFLKTYSVIKSHSYYEGKEAEVLYEIPENGFGKVNIKIEDRYEQLLAKSEDGSRIAAGSVVRIKKYVGGHVIVERIS